MKRIYIKPLVEELACDNDMILCASATSKAGIDTDGDGIPDQWIDPSQQPNPGEEARGFGDGFYDDEY